MSKEKALKKMNELCFKMQNQAFKQAVVNISDVKKIIELASQPTIQTKELTTTEQVIVNGELLFILDNKSQWVNRVPAILPDKIRSGETWIWVDINGDVFECGKDFMVAEEKQTYPCKVYRLSNVAGAHKS